MWSFGRWLRSRDGHMGNGTATGLFGKYLSSLPEKAFEPKLALKTVNVAADENRLPIF
jgi:hypothetical protein